MDALLKFRNEHNWAQFHTTKDLVLALNIEAAGLLEAFLWNSSKQTDIDRVKALHKITYPLAQWESDLEQQKPEPNLI